MVSISDDVFRPAILRVAGHPWFRRLATESPPGRLVAARFVAGETLDDAISSARVLAARGVRTMFDHLGENVTTEGQAAAAAAVYIEALERLRAEPELEGAISVKLTQLGLDRSTGLCLQQMERVLDVAGQAGTLVMIDMEAAPYVDRTLEVFAALHQRSGRIGVCLQAYLRRTAVDVSALPPRSRVRLVKGAYLEPPELVLGSRVEVDRAFARLFATLRARGHAVDVATHDPRLIAGVRRVVEADTGGWSGIEFQMLYGIRRDLQDRLARDGLPVRVYLPYGTEWYPYLTRRLAERPANMWFFARNLMRSS